jgi:hypothetical protein
VSGPILRSTPERPTDFQLEVITNASLLRGAIITSYAQVEMLLADIVMRCRQRDEYVDVYDKFPYRLEDRIKAVRRIVGHPGPLNAYRAEVEALVDGLHHFEEIRHFMAHGLLVVTTTPNKQHTLTYRMYRPVGQGEAEAGLMQTTLEELDEAARAIGSYAHSFVALFGRMYLEQGLEPS